MDSLRGAALALKRSPRLVRKKLDKISGKKEHKKLMQSLDDEVTICVKQLGSFDLKGTYAASVAETAVLKLLSDAKKARVEKKKKLDKLFFTVAPDKISVEDAVTKELLKQISLESISNWRIYSQCPQVFSFTEDMYDDLVCHAFISPKASVTEAITRAVLNATKFLEDSKKTCIDKKRDAIENKLDEDAEELYSDLGNSENELRMEKKNAQTMLSATEQAVMDVNFGLKAVEIEAAEEFSSSDDDELGSDSMKYIYCNLGLKDTGDHSMEHLSETKETQNCQQGFLEASPIAVADNVTSAAVGSLTTDTNEFETSTDDNLISFDT